MAFHEIRAYFTGYDYVPEQQQPEIEWGGEPDMESIVETIIREKVDQLPQEQATTAEGDTTFQDLIRDYEVGLKQPDEGEPPPLPSVLDGGMPGDELLEGEPTGRLSEPDDLAHQEEMPDEEVMGEMPKGEDDMPMSDEDMNLMDTPEGAPVETDRLGLDSLFGEEYDTVVGDAQDWMRDEYGAEFSGPEEGEIDIGAPVEEINEGELGIEDEGGLELEDEGDLGLKGEGEFGLEDESDVDVPGAIDEQTRSFINTILLAEEREAKAMARTVLANTTININIDQEAGTDAEVTEGPPDLGMEEPLEEGLSEETVGAEGFGEETEPKGEGESFDELEDTDIFESQGDEGDEVEEFGI